MGSDAYIWVTNYDECLEKALNVARAETFIAGKFLGAEKHPISIEDALKYNPEGGTGSLLDIRGVSIAPEYLCVNWLTSDELLEFFHTKYPQIEDIKKCQALWESIGRGEARAIALFEKGKPVKICFAAYTIDSIAMGNWNDEDVEKSKQTNNLKKYESEKKRAEDFLFFARFFPKHIEAVINGTIGYVPTEGKRLAKIAERYQGDRDFISLMRTLCIDISKYIDHRAGTKAPSGANNHPETPSGANIHPEADDGQNKECKK